MKTICYKSFNATKHNHLLRTILPYVLAALVILFFMSCAFADDSAVECIGGTGSFKPPPQGTGILTQIIFSFQSILNAVSQAMFNGIAQDAGFQLVVRATVTLYVAVYGLLFMFGMVELTIYEFAVRLIKIGVVAWIISPTAWAAFSSLLGVFFNDGTNHIVAYIVNSSTFTQPEENGNLGIDNHPPFPPMYIVDPLMAMLSSTKMALTGMTMFITFPYGPIMALLLTLGMGSLFKSLLEMTWLYIMSLVVRALLFGIAPIFFVFLLFTNTRHLFDGWLNQVLNACFRVIFAFVLWAYFIGLLQGAFLPIYEYPLCYVGAPADKVPGTDIEDHGWRFPVKNTNPIKPFTGQWNWEGAQGIGGSVNKKPIFPIPIMVILEAVLLAEVLRRSNAVFQTLAGELAGASLNIGDMKGSFSSWMSPASGTNNSPIANVSTANAVGVRLNPEGAAGASWSKISSSAKSEGSSGAIDKYKDSIDKGVGKR